MRRDAEEPCEEPLRLHSPIDRQIAYLSKRNSSGGRGSPDQGRNDRLYPQKLSEYGACENFTLPQSVGIQFRLRAQLDFRAGLSDFHFSNGFVIPNNPGTNEMSYNAGLSDHLTKRKAHSLKVNLACG
jgi:hypothetical protein